MMANALVSCAQEEPNEQEIVSFPGRCKSIVWDYFGFYKDPEGKVDKVWAVCRMCKGKIKYNGNTTNLSFHLHKWHKKEMKPTASKTYQQQDIATFADIPIPFADISSEKQLFMDEMANRHTQKAPLVTSTSRDHEITEAIFEYIVQDLQPMSSIDGLGFQKLVQTLDPSYSQPSSKYFEDAIMQNKFQTLKQCVVFELGFSEFVSVTTDRWQSWSRNTYLTITACFVDSDSTLQKRVLETATLDQSELDSQLPVVIREVVSEWNLIEKQPIFVTDCAESAGAASAGGFAQFACLGQSLNDAVFSCFCLESTFDLLTRTKRVALFFKQNQAKSCALLQSEVHIEMLMRPLPTDLQNEWLSTYDMLETVVELHPVLYDVTDASGDILDTDELIMVEQLLHVLQPLKAVITVLCEEKNPTASLIQPLLHKLQHVDLLTSDNDSDFAKKAKEAISDKLSQSYSDMNDISILTTATVLDPRFKSLDFMDDVKKEHAHSVVIDSAADFVPQDTFGHEGSNASENTQLPVTVKIEPGLLENEETGTRAQVKRRKLENGLEQTGLTNLLGNVVYQGRSRKSPKERAGVELKRYLDEEAVPLNGDPYLWWKTRTSSYPALSRLAKKFLCIPATSVPARRIFGSNGDPEVTKRSCLPEEHVHKLIFLNANQSAKHSQF